MRTVDLDGPNFLTPAGAMLSAMGFYELAESMTGDRKPVLQTEHHADMVLKMAGFASVLDD